MATTVDMRHVNFWRPSDFRPNTQRTASQKHHRGSAGAATSQNQATPLYNKPGPGLQSSSKSKSESKCKSKSTATQSINDRIRTQGIVASDRDSPSCSDEDTLPPLEEALQNTKWRANVQDSLQHSNNSGADPSGISQTAMRAQDRNGDSSQGTKDSPLIVEDDEMDSPSIEAAAIPASADPGIEATTDLKKPINPVNQEAWYDIEDGCYVFEDLQPLEKDGLALSVAQDNHSSLGLPENVSSQHSDGHAECPSQESGADDLPQPSNDSEHDCGESVSEREKDTLQAFKEQGNLSLANTSKLPNSHHPSPEPACLEEDHNPDRSAPEVVRDGSPLGNQPEETAMIVVFSEEEPQEKAANEVRDAEDDTSKPEQAQTVAKQSYEGGAENIGSYTYSPECRASSQIIHSEEDEEDEEPRPAKRRKRKSQLTHQSPVYGEQQTPPSSRSPSATQESVPVAEYQEWPFQGFLKRTRIGDETTYTLEFKLPSTPKLLSLPVEACDDEDVPATSMMRPKAPSKVSIPASRHRKRFKWTLEEDKKLVDMKKRGCSWKVINAAFPDRTPGTIQVHYSTKLKRLA